MSASLSLLEASDSKTMSDSFTTPWTEIFIGLPWEANGAASTWLRASVAVITSLSGLWKGTSPFPVAGLRTRPRVASNDVWLAIVNWRRCRWSYKSDDGEVKNSSNGRIKGKLTKMVAFCKEMSTERKTRKFLTFLCEDNLQELLARLIMHFRAYNCCFQHVLFYLFVFCSLHYGYEYKSKKEDCYILKRSLKTNEAE